MRIAERPHPRKHLKEPNKGGKSGRHRCQSIGRIREASQRTEQWATPQDRENLSPTSVRIPPNRPAARPIPCPTPPSRPRKTGAPRPAPPGTLPRRHHRRRI